MKDLNLSWFRSTIGYVGQEPVLFEATIKQNLLIANPEATDSQIKDACERAQAWEFIQGLEKKLDTFCGTDGTLLSGGQKQRIAIARIILKDPKILLFDEATSALDSKNEKLIQKSLDEISQGKTTIVIAHRLATISNVDRIIVIKDGEVHD